MATLLSNQTQLTKYYQTERQIKYLHLEAEVDMLLQKLTALIERKQLASDESSESTTANS